MPAWSPGTVRAPRHDAVARLPFMLEFGRHRLTVEWRDADAMRPPRAGACLDLEQGCIELSPRLEGLALAEAFLRCVLRLCDGGRATRSAWTVAAPAHRLATGLIEFAWRNPRAWLWFNLLLARHLPGHPRFDRALHGALEPLPAPRRWKVGRRSVELSSVVRVATVATVATAVISDEQAPREVDADAAVGGSERAVVLLRELVHAMHAMQAQGGTAAPRWRVQARDWLRLVRDNPQGWCWLLQAMQGPPATRQALH